MNVNPLSLWTIEYDNEFGMVYATHVCEDGFSCDGDTLTEILERVDEHSCI